MPANTIFYLMRHGETETQARGLVSGAGTDTVLTETGRDQMERVGKSLQASSFDHLFISSLKRSRQSAEAFLKGYGKDLPIEVVPGAEEVHYGEWDGKPKEAYTEAKKVFFAANPDIDGLTVGVGKGAESFTKAAERFSKILLDAARKYPGQTLVWINHSGNIRSLVLTKKVEMPADVFENLKKSDLAFGKVFVCESDGRELAYRETFDALEKS